MSGMKDLLGDQPYNLYGGEPPHQSHSTTSQRAAAQIKDKIGPLHKKILSYLDRYPNGACDERLGRELDMPMNTLRPRRRELQLMQRIRDSGRTESTDSGREAVIWIINRGIT